MPGMDLVELVRETQAAPATVTDRVKAAISEVGTDENAILKWCADRQLELQRSECRRALKRLSRQVEAA